MPDANPPALTPFVAPMLRAAREALEAELRAWLALEPGWRVSLERHGTTGPSHVELRAPGGESLRMVLHGATPDDPPSGWVAGPLGVGFVRPAAGAPHDPMLRALLRRMAASFAAADAALVEQGVRVHELHRRWAELTALDDRHYRHVERAHSGTTGLLRAGFRCNQDCHFCWQGRDWPSAPDALVFTWLEELAAHGVERLTICGGEPTIWKPLPELIERAHHVHGMRVHVNTNAIRLKQPGFAAMLREKGLETLLVSLHSADAAVSDRMTRAPGTHVRTVEGIQAALDAGLVVVLNCAVERENVEGLEAHARFVVREFVEGRAQRVGMVNYSQPGRYHDEPGFLARLVPVDVAREHVTRAARVLDAAGVLLEITGSCGFPQCVVSEVPELVPWRAGESFDAHHASARSHALAVCNGCAVKDRCIGVRHEYVTKWGDRGLVPFAKVPTSDWYERLRKSPLASGWDFESGADG